MKHTRVLTIQDYSSIGRCSLTAALPILSACGQEPVGLPTALLSTQTAGISGFTFNDLYANMLPSYKHWQSLGIKFDCLYTGFIGTIDTVNATLEIAKGLKEKGTIIAIDPACAENGKLYSIFDDEYKSKIFELCKLADIVMPNFTEGKMLAGLDMELDPTPENARMILNILRHNGYKKVLLSGIIDDDKQGTATLNNGKINFQYNTHFNEYIHGAGDCLSSAFIGKLMSGHSFEDSAQKAVDFCHDLISISLSNKADLRFGMLIERALPLLMK